LPANLSYAVICSYKGEDYDYNRKNSAVGNIRAKSS
jgi:hypothetical protein